MQRWVSSARVNVAALLLLAAAAGSCVDSTGPAALTAPRNVTVTLISPHSAKITWTPADAPEVYYVETYFIYRDGVKIGESVTTSFTDNGLSEGTTYKYRVAAVGVGLTSEQSVESATSAITIPDVTAPTVTATNPLNGATAIARAATISATFSEPIDQATLTTTTFALKTSGGTTISGAVTYNSATKTAVFTPSGPLPNATTFTATLTTGVKDVPGNRLASDFSFSFTTRDEVPPTVTSMSPANGSTGIPVNTGITVTFSEPMDAATIGSSVTLQITSSGVSVPGTVTYVSGSLTASFVPSAPLAFSTSYTLTATTSAKDVSGNPLAASVSSVFTTAGAPDTTPPSVLTVSPISGAADVSINTTVTILFSESMDAGTVSSSTVLLKATSTGSTIPATVSLNAATNTATVTPSAPLSFGTQYSVVVMTGAKDAAGNPLAAQFTSSFTTASAPDTTPPSVVSITPANGLNGVSVFTSVTVVFSEPMNAASINGSTISLALSSNSSPVAGTLTYNVATNTATFTPSAALTFSTGYTISVTTAASD
ncbi:MAG TPA: Ig-like domain-containing protein, partial [Gemmatimonadaceae bacterium]|nr:Ig-like domain-containing protein [Gemmatimonadaceae bacterium]